MEKEFKKPLLILLWVVVIFIVVFLLLMLYGMWLGFTDPELFVGELN